MHDAQDAVIGEGITAREMIQRLSDEAPDQRVAVDLARQVYETALRRRLIGLAEELMATTLAAPVSVTADELRLQWDESFTKLFRSTSDLGLRSLSEVSDALLEKLKHAGDRVIGISPGLAKLEELIGLLQPGRLYLIAGAPGSGKSSLVLQMLLHGARRGFHAALYTPEMEADEIAERALAAGSGLSAVKIETNDLQSAEYEAIWNAGERLRGEGGGRLFLDASPVPSLAMIRGRSQRKQRMGGLDVVAIDHIGYLAREDRKQSDYEALDANLRGLKQLAKELRAPVIAVTQFGTDALRDMARWPHRRPTQGDILYAGMAERHADVVLLIHREEYFLRRNVPGENDLFKGKSYVGEHEARLLNPKIAGRAELILTKRRGGEGSGVRNVEFDAKRTRFNDAGPSLMPRSDEFALVSGY
jgi:replicative DNA helicase